MGGQVRITTSSLELPGGVTVRFMRTLRLPETGTHPLPPGLGAFPLRRVKDYPDRVPSPWREQGGVLLPVRVREAMWLSFSAPLPAALQVGVGTVCAVSGRPWSDRLSQDPQNYLALPRQPWLDGVNTGQGTIRQFVAVPPGPGAPAAVRVPGPQMWGGIQLQVFELREESLERLRAARRARERRGVHGRAAGQVPGVPVAPVAPGADGPAPDPPVVRTPPPDAPGPDVGLCTGGRIRQDVYRDPRPLADWREEASGRVYVHLATAPQWREITGEPAPDSPVDRAAYDASGLPWFDHYEADGTDGARPGGGPAGPVRVRQPDDADGQPPPGEQP